MISLDQVYLLEQKVESAVAKIQQLQAENDALRKQCSELTNALSSKTEQLSTFENDQTQIENGIRKALDRLNSIENSVLKSVGQVAATSVAPAQAAPKPQPVAAPAPQQEKTVQAPVEPAKPVIQPQSIPVQQSAVPSFDTMETFEQPEQKQPAMEIEPQFTDSSFAPFETMPESDEPDIQDEDESSDGLGFDIF